MDLIMRCRLLWYIRSEIYKSRSKPQYVRQLYLVFMAWPAWVNGLASLGLLSCSAKVGMTLQLPYMLHACANFGGLLVASHPRVQLRVSTSLHNLEHFFTLSHSLPLQDSHLNTGLLIAKIQANLARNKTNKMVDKIQPYRLSNK